MIRSRFLGAATIAALFFAVSPAHALLSRAWVSGHGTDAAGCGAPGAPCRTFQYVHDNIIAPGGEIDVLDPAGYGAVIITKGISIVNNDVGEAGVQSSSGAVGMTISAGEGDAVYLKGLTFSVSATGIRFNSGASLEVEDCHFITVGGIDFLPTTTSSLSVRHSSFAFSVRGINMAPQAGGSVNANIETVRIVGEGISGSFGIRLDGSQATSSTPSMATVVYSRQIYDSAGFSAIGSNGGAAQMNLIIDNSSASGDTVGIAATGAGAVVRLYQAIVTNSLSRVLTQNGAQIITYGNNVMDGPAAGMTSAPLQ